MYGLYGPQTAMFNPHFTFLLYAIQNIQMSLKSTVHFQPLKEENAYKMAGCKCPTVVNLKGEGGRGEGGNNHIPLSGQLVEEDR